jgi:hypothetical protein
LVLTYHFSVVFGVELGGELRGVHQIAKHDGELAGFGFGRAQFWWRYVRRLRFLDDGLLWCLGRWRGRCVRAFSITDPDQNALILLHCQFLRIDQLVLQVCQGLVIESKLTLQKAIG